MAPKPHMRLVAYARHGHANVLPQLVNLSHGAMVVRAKELYDAQQLVAVTIHFADFGEDVDIETEVEWANQKLGDMALKFVKISEAGQDIVDTFLNRQDK